MGAISIKIKCRGAGELSITQLTPLQGAFKILTDENRLRLCNELMGDGFIEPISVWEDKNSSKIYILNGHQRYATLMWLRENGWEGSKVSIPQLPVNFVEAENLPDAKKKILALASQYGSVSTQGLRDLLDELGIETESVLEQFNFPEIDMASLMSGLEVPVIIGQDFEANPLLTDRDLNDVKVKDPDPDEEEAPKPAIFDIDAISAAAFDHFRKAGFPYPSLTLHEMMQELNKLLNTTGQSLIHSTLGYRVADTFHRHRFEAAAQGMASPVDSFMLDAKLKKAIRWHLEGGGSLGTDFFGTLSLVSGTQACSNFRPAFAKFLYDKWCPKGGLVFDSSTGYGGRLVGFLASHAKGYFGTDPNKPTYQANLKIAEALGAHKNITLKNSPIEDLDVTEIKGRCDFAFTSPPYFTKEIYAEDDKQSCVRYPKYEDWLQGFLRPMLQKQYDALKPDAINVVNIEDVKLKNKIYPLVDPTVEIAKEIGFELVQLEKFELPNRTKSVDGEKETEEAFERVIILKRNSRKSAVRK